MTNCVVAERCASSAVGGVSAVPVPCGRLLSKGLLILLLLAVVFDLVNYIMTLMVGVVTKFPKTRFNGLFGLFVHIAKTGVKVCVSILPVVLLFYYSTGGFLNKITLTFICKCFKAFRKALLGCCPVGTDVVLMSPAYNTRCNCACRVFPTFVAVILAFLVSIVVLTGGGGRPDALAIIGGGGTIEGGN